MPHLGKGRLRLSTQHKCYRTTTYEAEQIASLSAGRMDFTIRLPPVADPVPSLCLPVSAYAGSGAATLLPATANPMTMPMTDIMRSMQPCPVLADSVQTKKSDAGMFGPMFPSKVGRLGTMLSGSTHGSGRRFSTPEKRRRSRASRSDGQFSRNAQRAVTLAVTVILRGVS